MIILRPDGRVIVVLVDVMVLMTEEVGKLLTNVIVVKRLLLVCAIVDVGIVVETLFCMLVLLGDTMILC